MDPQKQKIYITVYLLWFFFGLFGAHRFYMQYYFTAVIFLLSLGVFGLAWLLDFGLIPSLIDEWEIKKNGGDIMLLTPEPLESPVAPFTTEPLESPVPSSPNEPFTPHVQSQKLPEFEIEETKSSPPGVKHVILVMMKDRSFDQMLGGLGNELGLDGADPQRFNIGSSGVPQFQTAYAYDFNQEEVEHDHQTTLTQMGDMRDMSGFIETCQRLDEKTHKKFYPGRWEEIMGFFPPGSLPALHTLARNYLVCDRWFSSVPGDTWPNVSMALTGTARGRVNVPDENEPYTTYLQSQPTLFDRLEESNISWNVYHDGFASSLIFPRQWDLNNASKYKTMSKFFKDCQESADSFPEFSLIEPRYEGAGNDDQPHHHLMNGQRLIADIYNAVRGNESLWNSSLIIIMYDNHGGFYDHVSPPAAINPDEHQEEFSFDNYGVRVPAILVSPYVNKGVDSTIYDHTSLLAYLTAKWDLGPLGDRVSAVDHFGSKLMREPREHTLPRIDGIPHDDTIRTGHSELPFTKMQRNAQSIIRKVAESKPSLSALVNEYPTFAEFEKVFLDTLLQHR